MMRKILAICDLEVAYASHFMEHMNHRRNLPFEVQAFSSLDKVKELVKEHAIEILLISERALLGRRSEVASWNIGQIVVLGEGIGGEQEGIYPTVSKYQSSDSVIREVMAVYAAESQERKNAVIVKKEMKVIGVYSPVGRCRKTSFALILGQLLSRDRNVLYLNLESCAGFEELFDMVYDRSLSDVIYYLRQKNENLIHHLRATVCTMENLDYIPPVPFPQDIASVTMEEWRMLFDVIRQESTYEFLILDIGDGVEDVCGILDWCDHIYMPVRQDYVSQSKIIQFEKLMAVCNRQEVLDRTVKLKLPYYTYPTIKNQYMKQMMWSEFGDYVRNLIRKEEL